MSDVDPHLIAAVAFQESRFDPKSEMRRSGASGLLQVTTAREDLLAAGGKAREPELAAQLVGSFGQRDAMAAFCRDAGRFACMVGAVLDRGGNLLHGGG